MKEFLLVFRAETRSNPVPPSPEEMQNSMKPWQDWLGSLAAQNKLVSPGNRLASSGNVVRPGNIITNGPFVELKEAVGGYTLIKASTLEEASELAKGCPILHFNGSVEVREIAGM